MVGILSPIDATPEWGGTACSRMNRKHNNPRSWVGGSLYNFDSRIPPGKNQRALIPSWEIRTAGSVWSISVVSVFPLAMFHFFLHSGSCPSFPFIIPLGSANPSSPQYTFTGPIFSATLNQLAINQYGRDSANPQCPRAAGDSLVVHVQNSDFA